MINFRWEPAPYNSSGAELCDICSPMSAITHRLYVKRTYKGSQKFDVSIDGRRLRGTFSSMETAKAAAEKEATERYSKGAA